MNEALSQCPFCASSRLSIIKHIISQQIQCCVCHAKGDKEKNAQSAINAWNQMGREQQLARKIESRQMRVQAGLLEP